MEGMTTLRWSSLCLRAIRTFTVLVERYKDAVQNLAYRMLSNVTEAEDVTQEAFVRAYTQLGTYKPAQSSAPGCFRLLPIWQLTS